MRSISKVAIADHYETRLRVALLAAISWLTLKDVDGDGRLSVFAGQMQ
jgi:hypothetical protein